MFTSEQVSLLEDKKKLLKWCITHTTCLVDQATYVEQLEAIEEELICHQ